MPDLQKQKSEVLQMRMAEREKRLQIFESDHYKKQIDSLRVQISGLFADMDPQIIMEIFDRVHLAFTNSRVSNN